MNQKEIVAAIGLENVKGIAQHASKLAEILKFLSSVKSELQCLNQKPVTALFGRKIENQGSKNEKVIHAGVSTECIEYTFATETGTYKVAIPANNKFHSHFCATLGINCELNVTPAKKLQKLSIDAGIVEAIANAKKFASKDELRPAMTGIFMEFENNKVRVIATDAHKLYMSQHFNASGFKKPFSILLRAKQIGKLDKPTTSQIDFQIIDDKKVEFLNCSNDLITGERFPNYKVVVPEYDKCITFDRKALLEKLAQVLPSANKATKAVGIGFSDIATLHCSDIDFSFECYKHIKCLANEVPEFISFFNGSMLTDCIKAFKSPTIKIYTSGEGKRPVIVSDDVEHALLMPLDVMDRGERINTIKSLMATQPSLEEIAPTATAAVTTTKTKKRKDRQVPVTPPAPVQAPPPAEPAAKKPVQFPVPAKSYAGCKDVTKALRIYKSYVAWLVQSGFKVFVKHYPEKVTIRYIKGMGRTLQIGGRKLYANETATQEIATQLQQLIAA